MKKCRCVTQRLTCTEQSSGRNANMARLYQYHFKKALNLASHVHLPKRIDGLIYLAPLVVSKNKTSSESKFPGNNYYARQTETQNISSNLRNQNRKLKNTVHYLQSQRKRLLAQLQRSMQNNEHTKKKWRITRAKLLKLSCKFQNHINRKKISLRCELRKQRKQREKILLLRRKTRLKRAQEQVRLKPWRKIGTFCTNPAQLYASDMSKTCERGSSTNVLEQVRNFQNAYKNLSQEEKTPYEAQALANKKVRVELSQKVRYVNLTAWKLFIKSNFASVSAQLLKDSHEKDRRTHIPLVSRQLAQMWKDLPEQEKEDYKIRAHQARSDAQKQVRKILAL